MPSEHDIRYKRLFSNPILVKELLQSFTEEKFIEELDFSTLERLDKSFITDEFKEKESDLIYRIKFQDKDLYIFLLFEFQSTVDRFMAVRMLRYICEFYEFLLQRRLNRLPAVFPILLYNGDRRWTAKKNVKELIEASIPDRYIPDFEYYLILENEFSKETLLSIKNAVSAIFYVENSKPEDLHQEIQKILRLLETEKPEIVILFSRWLNNLLGYHDIEINESLSSLKEVREMFATKLKKYRKELLQEGIEQGIAQGIEKGIEKGTDSAKIEIAKKMLSLGYTVDNICAVTGLSRKEVNALL